jgi:pentatricopeptide repeat protein
MLPKVATQLIHHTTRAVAAVQGSGHAFRNVLQSSSSGTTTTVNWSGVGTSGPGLGGAGTGAGGAKYQSSSKFYHGYQVGFLPLFSVSHIKRVGFVPQGAGRTLTQASQASVDSGLNQTDDTEDPFPRPGPTKSSSGPLTNIRRPRSHSLVLSSKGQVETTETGKRPGVLEVVRIHARASHAFAPQNSAVDGSMSDPTPLESRPKLTRRASTSSVTSPLSSDGTPSTSFHPQPAVSSDSSVPQSITPLIQDSPTQIRAKLAQYSNEKDGSACKYLKQLLENGKLPQDTAVYEDAIRAVADTCMDKSDLSLLSKLFDEMIQCDLSPSADTYRNLIIAHLNRDFEVYDAVARHQHAINARRARLKGVPKHRDQDIEAIRKLKTEPNFRNAIRIFQAANKAQISIPSDIYANLLHGCVRHLDEYATIRIFAHLEKEHGSRIPALVYLDTMELYLKTKNLAAAEETFSGFKKASQLGNVSYEPITIPGTSLPVFPVDLWNMAIRIYLRAGRQVEAVAILEAMLDSPDPSVPSPSLSTFHTLIGGFCIGNDIETALKWFRRLLQETTVHAGPFTPPSTPSRPDALLWSIILDALGERSMIDEINSLYSQWLTTNARDSLMVIEHVHRLVVSANFTHLEALQWSRTTAQSEVQKQVDNVVEKTVGNPRDWILKIGNAASDGMHRIVKLYVRGGRFDEAAKFLQTYIVAHQAVVGIPQARDELSSTLSRSLYALRNRVRDITEWILRRQVLPPFAVAKVFVSIANDLDLALSAEAAEAYLSIYEASKKSELIDKFTVSDAETLIAAGVHVIYANKEPAERPPESHPLVRFESLLVDIARNLQDLSKLSPTTIDGVLRGLGTWYPVESLRAVLEKLGEPWFALWDQPFVQEQISLIAPTHTNNIPTEEITQPSTPSSDTAVTAFRISASLSQKIDEHLQKFYKASPIKAYERFIAGHSDGFYPGAHTFCRLINALGRAGEIEKVDFVYEAAQHAIATTKATAGGNSDSPWCHVEDHMIIALAHAGDVERAHGHRLRILEYGGTPSADAYGALISCVKDTTDDSANAYSLYRESQIRGVAPNVFLYNTMISKLAKARKVDLVMELFSKMKENGFWPTSVTYGAVIGACSRVGDVESAEAFFQEMSSQPNFRPRVPPFNTMMQLYTHTKRDRQKVLQYYDSMVSARVRPTAHTYKVCPAPDLCTSKYANLGPSC